MVVLTPSSSPFIVNRSFLDSGIVLVNTHLRRLLPARPPVIPLTLRSHDGRSVTAELHNQHDALYGPDLKGFFDSFETNQFGVTVLVEHKNYTLIFSPFNLENQGQVPQINVPPIMGRTAKNLKTRKTIIAKKPAKSDSLTHGDTSSDWAPGTILLPPASAPIDLQEPALTNGGIQAPPPITFDDTPWAGIQAALERGEPAGSLEEYVHQRAVLLSANPGFDTLMSLNVVRNVIPFEHQIKAVKDVLQRMRGRALLCDEVGLGKTIEACLVVTEYLLRGLARKALVLCPSSLVEQWAEEFRSKFNLGFVLFDDPKFQNHPHPWQTFDRIIVSIDTVKREPHRSRVLSTFFDIVVVDEAHRCRNRSTLNWSFVSQLQKKYILLLTATPVQNDLEELYNLITLLRPGQLETATSFTRNFITRGDRMQPKNVQRLRMLTREVMIRNKRGSVGISLPRRSADTIQVSLSPPEAALYEGVTDYVRRQYASNGAAGNTQMTLKTLQREVGSSPQAVVPTLLKLADTTKDPNNQEQLRNLLTLSREIGVFSKGEALIHLLRASGNDKVIVFTGFIHTQEALAKLCHDAGIPAVLFHGQMRRLEKEDVIQRFAGDIPVLISTESGGEGRNLQFCHTMVNFDLPWNPMRIEQRIGRIHRIGQQHSVRIYNLAAANTIEEQILNLLDSKINLFELVVGELDMILGDLTEGRDFEDLLMEIWAGSASRDEANRKLANLGDSMARSKEHYLKIRQSDAEIFG